MINKILLISSSESLGPALQRKLRVPVEQLDSVDRAVIAASGGGFGTAVLHGYSNLSVIHRIITLLRDACPSMAITCVTESQLVPKLLNSRLKQYIYRVLPDSSSIGQIALAVRASQEEHQQLIRKQAAGENLTVQLSRGQLGWSRPRGRQLGTWLSLSLMFMGLITLTWYLLTQRALDTAVISDASPVDIPDDREISEASASNADSAPDNPDPDTAALDRVDQIPARYEAQTANNLTQAWLQEADLATRNGQLIAPFADNAAWYYQQVLTNQPQNASALAGLAEVADLLAARIDQHIGTGHYDQAAADLVALRGLAPEHPRLVDLNRQLLANESAKAKRASTISRPKSSGRPATELTNLPSVIRHIDHAIDREAYQNAVAMIANTRGQGPLIDAELDARHVLIRDRMTGRGNTAVLNQDWARARDAASVLDQLGEYAASDRILNQIVEVKANHREDTLSPPQTIRMATPQYPEKARRRSVEGYVVVNFTVQADGSIDGLTVQESQPRGVFDSAALRAIRESSFTPGTRNGIPASAQVRKRINFVLEQ